MALELRNSKLCRVEICLRMRLDSDAALGSLYCGGAGVRQPPSVLSPSDWLHGRSIAPLVKARGFGMTDLL